jgi:hypothetical protein
LLSLGAGALQSSSQSKLSACENIHNTQVYADRPSYKLRDLSFAWLRNLENKKFYLSDFKILA